MSLRTKRIGLALALVAFAVCLLPAFQMTLHDDDIGELQMWHQYGLSTPVYRYYSWSGAFGYTFTASAIKALPIWLPTIALLSLWLIILSALIYVFLRDAHLSIGGAAFLIVCMILLMPPTNDPLWTGTAMSGRDQAFYWQSALAKHTSCVVAFTFYLWCALQRWLPTRLSLVLCGFAAFFAAGFSEVSIAFLPLMLCVGCYRRRLAGLLGACMSWGLILLAPGNAVRSAANYGVGAVSPGVVGGLLKTLVAVPGYFKAYLPAWPVLVFIVLALVLVSMSTNTRKKHLSQQDKVLSIKAFLVAIASVILAFLPSYVAFGSPIPERAYIVAQFVVVAGIVAAVVGVGWQGNAKSLDNLVHYVDKLTDKGRNDPSEAE